MIELKKAIDTDFKFVSQFGFNNITDVYIIIYNKEYAGAIEFSYKIGSYSDDYYSIFIEYLDILNKYRRKGIASSVISLLSEDSLNAISGNSLPNNTSISFWKSVGADFGGEEEDLAHYEEFNECISFSL